MPLRQGRPHYEVVMANGDRGECDSALAVFTAATTMLEDDGFNTDVSAVFRNGKHDVYMTSITRRVINELLVQREE